MSKSNTYASNWNLKKYFYCVLSRQFKSWQQTYFFFLNDLDLCFRGRQVQPNLTSNKYALNKENEIAFLNPFSTSIILLFKFLHKNFPILSTSYRWTEHKAFYKTSCQFKTNILMIKFHISNLSKSDCRNW